MSSVEINVNTPPPKHMFGCYELIEVVGQGGMGVVYRAHDKSLDRMVALKVLRHDLRTQSHIVARFGREAQAVAALDHPNIVHIFSVGSVGDIPYIAMEFIEGKTLSLLIKQERRLHWEHALEIAEQVAKALASAHDTGVIHRDIKPGNIIIDAHGHAYVTDFGIAKVLTAETQLTVDGSRIGTPQYMSPEQCQSNKVTASSDIYAVGILIYQMLTRKLPFQADTPVTLLKKIITEPPRRLTSIIEDLPRDVERLVAYLLEKKPRDRPKDAHDMAKVIARVRAGKALDEKSSDMSGALASFRGSIGAATPTPSPRLDTQTTTIERAVRTTSALTRMWTAVPEYIRASVLLIMLIAFGGVTGFFASSHFDPMPKIERPTRNYQSSMLWSADIELHRFVEEAVGVSAVNINLDQFQIADVAWLSQSSSIAVQLDGLEGTNREGHRALVELDLAARTASMLVPPVATPLKAGLGPPLKLLCAPNVQDSRNPLASKLLISTLAKDQMSGEYSLRVASWNTMSGMPYPSTVFYLGDSIQHRELTTVHPVRMSDLALRPNGPTMALAVSTSKNSDSWLVVERDIQFKETGRLYAPLTDEGNFISQLDYSPDGMQVAYLREIGDDSRELWIVQADGTKQAPILIAKGDIDFKRGGFSADGNSVLISDNSLEKGKHIKIVSTSTASTIAELGNGSTAAWHKSGQSVAVIDIDRKGTDQLWLVPIKRPQEKRQQLTHLDAGTQANCWVSPDGRYIVAPAAGKKNPTLLVVDLQQFQVL